MAGQRDGRVERMYRKIDWMKPADQVILQELARYGGWMKPASLKLNVHFSGDWVGQRCRTLTDHNLLERHDDPAEGAYRITDRGQEYIEGTLSVSDLEASDG